ncbi:hypothetical protein OFO01_07340 [Campylobacter sp. JMF_01 NE2]|uniref:hypothetical protein n=1 Tax=unclassified Campylobacter TaxID=2593542 RepID=UPI0022E9DCFF|nr:MULTISPECIES: hypothetical protein [unclassified Campylobacter]MDA3053222.1 hypothetical protein [Campylobacter sp. JMF_03 NE3]MDA3067595.1 hypothetical protein [Campylobacter sp. JMF_01 NE2]
MSFWKNTFYFTSLLMVIVVVLTLCISQALLTMLFTIQTKEVAQALGELQIQIPVFLLNLFYIVSVFLFLANLKIAKKIAILAVILHLLFVFVTMLINYNVTHNVNHLVNSVMIVVGAISFFVFLKLSKDKQKLIQETIQNEPIKEKNDNRKHKSNKHK